MNCFFYFIKLNTVLKIQLCIFALSNNLSSLVISTFYCTHRHLSTKIFSILGTNGSDLKKSHRIFNLNGWCNSEWRDHLHLHVMLTLANCSIFSSDSQYLTWTILFHIDIVLDLFGVYWLILGHNNKQQL